jgi:hypothetical protein
VGGAGVSGAGSGAGVPVVGAIPPSSGVPSSGATVPSGVAPSSGVVCVVSGTGAGVVVVGTSPSPASLQRSVLLASWSSQTFSRRCFCSAMLASMNCFQIAAGYVPPATGSPRHSVSIGFSRSG